MFSYKCNLKCHICIHRGVKSFKCDICGKVFLERGGMKHPLRTHTGKKPPKCDMCGKAFSNNDSLKSHMCTHTQARNLSNVMPVEGRFLIMGA